MVKLDLTKIWQYIYGTFQTTKTTFRRLRKTQVLEIKPIPTYRRTAKQDQVRNTFTFCIDIWRSLSPEQKQQWKEKALPLKLTGYQTFLSYCLRNPQQFLHYKITIDNSNNSNNLTDYQILINVSGDATFFNTFNNSHAYMEAYDDDGKTPLNFYVEEWDTVNKNAKIWVKIPLIPANSIKYIYLKYNPRRTTSLSNGDNTFLFFDNFSGATINTTKWYVRYPNECSIVNGWLKLISASGRTYGDPYIFTNSTFGNVKIITKVKRDTANSLSDVIFSLWDTQNYVWIQHETRTGGWDNDLWQKIAGSSSAFADYRYQWGANQEVRYEIKIIDRSFNIVRGPQTIPTLSYSPSLPSSNRKVGFAAEDLAGSFWVDYIFITKITTPEPAVSYIKQL